MRSLLPPRLGLRAATGGPVATAAGLTAFMVCGIAVALLAAVQLDAAAYTVFSAFSGLLGILVLGPAAALEQEATLAAGEARRQSRRRAMLRRGAALWALLAAVVLLTPRSWGVRLLDDERELVTTLLLVGAPAVFLVAVGRGSAIVAGSFRRAGALHAITGISMVVLPAVLRLAGLSWLDAFLIGALSAWLPGLVLLAFTSSPAGGSEPPRSQARPARTTAIQLVNLLVIANLLATPAVLRWHAERLGTAATADLQLFVSITRLTTTLVLGCLPLLIHRLARTPPERRPHLALGAAGAIACLSLLAAAISTLVARPVVDLISGRSTAVPLQEFALAALPVAFLSPAVVLLAAALVSGRHGAAVLGWGIGLVVLAEATAIDDASAARVLVSIALAAAAPFLVLLGDVLLRGRGVGARVAA